MPNPARDRLARLLAGTGPAGADSAMLRLPGDVLKLEVANLGPIQTPIRAAQAKQLIGTARPAQYGRGEDTLSDTSVRDTWEVAPDQVSIGGPTWQAHLDAALEDFCDELGLPAGARLTAELHSLLVYGKGQFFLPHQDSEKYEAMVASLVVMLPSVHTGGEFVVDDAGNEQTYGGSRDDLVLVAFYADRRHEVRPVDAIEPVLSMSELAARLRVSVQTLYDLRSQGGGPRGFRVGRELRFRLSEVNSWLGRMEQADAERHRGVASSQHDWRLSGLCQCEDVLV